MGLRLLSYVNYEQFVRVDGPRLRAGLVAAYGPDVGADATAEALSYGFEHWSRVSVMGNPSGYLYRVGQTAARRLFRADRPTGYLPDVAVGGLPDFEPGLAGALEALTDAQRVAVVMVVALGWTQVDAAAVLDVDVSTLRTHLTRAMTKLRTSLKVNANVC